MKRVLFCRGDFLDTQEGKVLLHLIRVCFTFAKGKNWINTDFWAAALSSADLEMQLVQLNHCDGVYSNY